VYRSFKLPLRRGIEGEDKLELRARASIEIKVITSLNPSSRRETKKWIPKN